LTESKLIDKYSRNLNYLRVSLTDRCNLRCIYCVPREDIPRLRHNEILRYEEILRIVHVGVGLGISKIRITGGEPLVRQGVCDFLEQLGRIEGLADISLTTNGVLLQDHIIRIRAAGIKRMNISLDTLKRKRFQQISGIDAFDKVWAGIRLAREAGFNPIKINVVALRGINDDELIDFARLSLTHPFHIRFIEQMPFESGKKNHLPLLTPEIKSAVEGLGELETVGKEINDGPAERFRFKGARGEIGFIRPISRHFCRSCNRLRLTADGHLRSCLLSDRQEDMKRPLRSGCSDGDLENIFFEAVKHKPSEHHLNDRPSEALNGRMFAIGG